MVDVSRTSGTGETEFIENKIINFTAKGNPDEDIATEASLPSVTIRPPFVNYKYKLGLLSTMHK
jgi:hypothetical protein